MFVVILHENEFGIKIKFILLSTNICKQQDGKNNNKQNIIYILILPLKNTIFIGKSFRETGTDIYLSTIGI